MFAAGFLGWTWDSFDFFTVSMTITEISEAFDVSYSDVSWVCFCVTSMTGLLMLTFSGYDSDADAKISGRHNLRHPGRQIRTKMAHDYQFGIVYCIGTVLWVLQYPPAVPGSEIPVWYRDGR